MTMEIEEKSVRGGEIGLPWKRFQSVVKGSPLLSKMGWTKENRREVLQLLQKLPVSKLVTLFSSQCAIISVLKIDPFLLAVECFRHGLPYTLDLNDYASSAPSSKKQKMSLDLDYLFLIRELYLRHSHQWPSLLESYSGELDAPTIRWLFGLRHGKLPLDYTKPFIKASKRILKKVDHEETILLPEPGRKNLTNKTILASECKNDDFVSIAGIPIRAGQSISTEQPLNKSPEILEKIREICVGIFHKLPIILVGGVGTGKTHLVNTIAQQTSRELLSYQLSPETDAATLIGGYIQASDGQFKWRPGPLALAASEGKWILLEDVDQAGGDCFTLIAQLIERNVLAVAGHGRPIVPHSNFRLFLTQRANDLNSSGPCSSLYVKCHLVCLPEHTKLSLENIVKAHFPDLLPQILCLPVQILNAVEQASGGQVLNRRLGVRDCLTFARRLSKARSSSASGSKQVAYALLDAIDIFAAHLHKREQKSLFYRRISDVLSANKETLRALQNDTLSHDPVEFLLDKYRPELAEETSELTAGRATIGVVGELSQRQLKRSAMVPTIIHSRIIEQAVLAINNHEPVLLVGETGTGKTSCIQYIAARTGNNLRVVNMSRQSQASDLIGSFRPVDASAIMRPVFAHFHQLMTSTYPKNDTVLSQMAFAFKKNQFEDVLLPMMKHVTTKATLDGEISPSFKKSWNRFGVMLQDADIRIRNKQISFAFVEGELVQAVRNGDWLLFDEINLAPAELLESISGLLDSGSLSIADISEPVITHPNFRIFGSMNPANDYAKKDLPDSLRNRFTELYVPEANSEQDISQIVVHYLPGLRDKPAIRNNLVKFYLKIRNEKSIRDMSGKGTTFSLRTLSRCLQSARDVFGATPSGIYQALQLSFVSGLDDSSTRFVEGMIEKYKFKNKTKMSQPDPGVPHVTIKSYHIYRGDETELVVDDKFIITDTVDQNLRNLSRAISARNYPILIQGETSTGKTSLISFLAKASGNKLIRINNHEHTDLQEYVGSYIPKSDGSLVFSHGALVKAMRNGWWLLLDELNLAPADVLEALNRVLDDNRELFIPETGEVIKAHPRFQLFGAQNPAGVYGGRKQLSRAFTNRFVQMEFCELSNDELEVIVSQKCDLPLSKSKLLVEAVSELRKLRRDSDVFGGKNSYATLRDLFRWADRYSKEKDMEYNDWDRHLALDGYFLLGGRCRSKIESENVKKVLERVFRRTLGTDDSIFSGERLEADGINERTRQNELQKMVLSRFYWGEKSRRMAILLDRCLKFNEPILLVGPTGCGKTTIVQLLSPQGLSIMNCHQQTEASDFIGGLRPVRENTGDSKALFKWSDGPLVESMKNGSVLLVDEISLADDSVLERLNSVLERERTLVLAEKGITDVADKDSALDILTATAGFQFIGTMNPGGDYGKKELSPALRNRMTEIWCEPPDSEEEFARIIQNALKRKTIAEKVSSAIWEFVAILKEDSVVGQQVVFSVRDALAYAEFINEMLERVQNQHTMQEIFVDTCRAVHLDSIGCSGFDLAVDQVASVKNNIEKKLFEMTFKYFGEGAYPETLLFKHPKCLGGLIPVGPGPQEPSYPNFVRTSSVAATTNRIGRAMLLPRPILLEGSPGVGKTSIVASLAAMCGYPVTRINLSEQTDVSDLFGADLPVEGGQGGQFEWKDGPLLIALKHGHWVILDELNLASQPVLEGLNSVFDHRGELFVPELNKTFNISGRGCRFFACQNPRVQGGGRKGLPKSFVNRFTRVYCNELSWQDLVNIVYATGPDVCLPGMRLEHFSDEFRSRFADEIEETASPRTIGLGQIENAPHYPDPRATRAMLIAIVQANNEACKYLEHSGLRAELNLRDIRRFTDLIGTGIDIAESFKLIYRARIRNMQDDDEINKIYLKWLNFPTLDKPNEQIKDYEEVKPDLVRFGVAQNKIRHARREVTTLPQSVLTLRERSHLEQILLATQHGWMVQMVGEAGVGKSTLVQLAADMTRQRLRLLSLSPATDVTDLLGAFEQYNFEETYENAFDTFRSSVRAVLSEEIELCEESILELMKLLEQQAEPEHTLSRIESLLRHKIPVIPSLYESIGKLKDLLRSEKKSDRGSFRWVDSDLVKAVEQGDWLVLDNANQASDALLDRLNSLLEPDGSLSIIERGNVNGEIVTIRPHPEFRIFILVDPFYGELSRPLRNRGVELFIKPHELSEYLSIGSTLCADQETAKMLYQSLSDSLCHKKFDGIFFSGCRRYNLEMTCGSSENNAFKSALAHCRHLLKRSSVSNTEAMEVILPIVGPAAPASLLESACSLYKPIEWDLAYNVARQYQTKLEETREAVYGERFSFMEIVSREIMCFMNKEEIFTALIGTTDAQNRDEHRENILQRASDWTFNQDLQQCIITIFKYMYENDDVQFDRKHNFISGSLLGALREGGSKARIGLMTPIIRTIMDLFGKRFQFDDEQELISLYFLIISLRRSNTSNQLSVGPYYAKCLLDVLEPYIPRLSGNKYKELRTEVATIRKFSTGEQLITSDVLSKIAYVGPFKTLEEFNETIKLWEMIAIINKDPNKFVATRSLIQLLSVLNHGTPGELTRDIEKISLDKPEKVSGISVHPFLFYLLFNQLGGDDESAIRIPGELLRNLACIGNSIDTVYKPSLASALAYISSTEDMIDYQVKGQFAFKCFADSIFGDLEWKSNRFGLLTLVPIGKYEEFTERYKLTSSRAWRNMRFRPTTPLRKIKSEINQILEKLKPLRQMPTIDPVVEANIEQGICQDQSAYYNDVSDALTFVRENTGIVSFCRQTVMDTRRNQLQERLNVLSTKVGERVGHDEYINLRKVIVDFIENTVTPVDDDMQINENLITTCRGFLSILHGFVWYPDIIVPISDLVTRLIYFSQKYLAKRKSESKHEEYQSLESKDRSLEPIIEASLVRFDQAEIFEHEQLLTTVCNFVNNWSEKKEEIEARKAEEESQFKFKNIDLGQSVEDQLEEEDQEYHEFFQSDSEFKSEAEGPKVAKECELENFAKMVDVFLKKDLSVDSSCKTENKFELMRLFKNPKELATTDSELISRLIKDKHHFDEIDVFVDSDFDVYRRSNPKEAASVCAPLRALGDRVAELETQFDDHPTLVSIRKMAEKVLELPLFAPVISLCTGIEMVLSRVNDWHQNAPKRLSLQAETDSLWNMVVEWRKRELHQWKAILETSINLEAQKSNHLFPEIWRVATQESLENIRLMCTSFLTSANCANFARRISLLRRVAQILRIEMGEQTAVIENICDFYQQFMPNVLKQTNAVKNSIEKELKEFVAIQRWKDINFYARKEAATKIRRQLFKFVKKLKESLVDKTAVDLFKIDHETLRLPVIQNVELLSPQETIPVKYEFEGDVLSQHPKLIPKMNNYSLSVSSSFEQFNKTFTAEITETTLDVKERFDKLASETQSIPSDGDREKRIKIVKSLLTKKRRALFDLFSVAKEAGLSFKRGLNRAKEETIISDWFYVKNSVNSNAKNRIIQKLLDVHSAKKSPDKAVSRNESDRLIGYTFHLASVTKTILQNANRLQSQVQRLERMYKIAETGIFMDLEAHYGVLSAKLTDCIFAIADLQLYVDCAPDEMNSYRWDCSPNFPALETMNKSEISEIKEFLSVLRKSFESLKNQLGSTETDNNVSRANEVNKLISQAEESCHHRAFSQIIKIVGADNHCENGGIRDMHIFVAAIKTLYQSMKLVQKEIASQTLSSRSYDVIPLNKFFAQTTFAFQNLVKIHSEANNSEKIFQNQAVLASMLESFIIPEREFADFYSFYSQILGKSEELTIFITKIIRPYINLAKSMLSHFHHMEIYNIALLDQLSTISFLVLSRGFCLPEDIADDVLEQEGEEIGGGGAGGGQAGTDDVTEEFEEEDLDDPLPGDSKADKNDKDQERGEGIEMDNGMDDADDVEDVEDQDDQDAQEEEEEPLEDEMGDLGDENLADKMDEKVWGDEDDRDEVEESNDNREEDGKGDERDQTQELQAKDDGLADGADNEKDEDLPEPPEQTQENEQPSDDENEQDQEGAQDESEFNAEEQAQPPPEDFETEAPDVDDVDFEEKNDGDDNEEDAKQDDDGIELDDTPPEEMSDAEGDEEDADNNENSKKDDDEEQEEEDGDEGGDKTENADDDQITEDDLNKDILAPRKGETPMAENQQNHERAAETCEATDMEQDNGDNTGGEEASGDQTGASENKSDGTKGNQQTQVERPKPKQGDEKSSESAELEKHETKEKESENDAEQETGTEFERDSTAQKEVLDEAEEGTREKIERMELEDPDKDVPKEEPMEVDHDESSKLESKTGDKIDEEKTKHSEENKPEEPVKEDIDIEEQLEKNNVIMTNHSNLSFDKTGSLEEMDRHALEVISMKPAGQEAQLAWRELNMLQSSQAQRLAEQLRLILEPKKASALKGDYRTGKRLNMRKVIPYIASQFQKDRIWLRRTKPRNRNHQIVLALDDSESMIDNKSKKLAFESLALVSSALKLIEIKNLGVFRFGAETESILQLGDELNDVVGGNIISRCTFEQQATDMVKMLDFARRSFSEADSEGVASKLLIVITDAQGIFKEGRAAVADQVKQARQRGMMVMLVVVDNAEKSITEIKSAKFIDGKVTWKSYLDDFPFPYYIILRNLERLPEVLAGALRQWFEILESES